MFLHETQRRFAELAQADPECIYSEVARAAATQIFDFLNNQLADTGASFGLVAGEPGSPCIVVQNTHLSRRLDIEVLDDGQRFQLTTQDLSHLHAPVTISGLQSLWSVLEPWLYWVSFTEDFEIEYPVVSSEWVAVKDLRIVEWMPEPPWD